MSYGTMKAMMGRKGHGASDDDKGSEKPAGRKIKRRLLKGGAGYGKG